MNIIAKEYLEKDLIKHVGMIECIKHDDIDYLYAKKDGVFIYNRTANLYMLATDSEEVSKIAVLEAKNPHLVVCHNEHDYLVAREKFELYGCNKCHQSLWLKKEKLPLKNICEIKKLETIEENITFVLEHYTLGFDRAHIEFIMNGMGLYGAYIDGRLVGFIGRHEERSIGLLEVLPEFRRLGIGSELEKFMINLLIDNDEIPYGHIIYGNDKSVNMQKKFGQTFCPTPIYWIFKKK